MTFSPARTVPSPGTSSELISTASRMLFFMGTTDQHSTAGRAPSRVRLKGRSARPVRCSAWLFARLDRLPAFRRSSGVNLPIYWRASSALPIQEVHHVQIKFEENSLLFVF